MGFEIPKILYSSWFYFCLMVIIIFINYFWGKPLPAKKPSVFFTKHNKLIARIIDISIICLIIFLNLSMLIFQVKSFFGISQYQKDLKFELSFLFISLIISSGWTVIMVGMLSVFQKNIIKYKRILLFLICLLPVLFTILAVLNEPEESHPTTIKLGLSFLISCFLINSPAIILGIGFFRFCWLVLNKLHLISGEYIE